MKTTSELPAEHAMHFCTPFSKFRWKRFLQFASVLHIKVFWSDLKMPLSLKNFLRAFECYK